MEHQLHTSEMRADLDFHNAVNRLLPFVKYFSKITARTINLIKILAVVIFISALFTYGVSHWLLYITGAYTHGTTATILSAKHLIK